MQIERRKVICSARRLPYRAGDGLRSKGRAIEGYLSDQLDNSVFVRLGAPSKPMTVSALRSRSTSAASPGDRNSVLLWRQQPVRFVSSPLVSSMLGERRCAESCNNRNAPDGHRCLSVSARSCQTVAAVPQHRPAPASRSRTTDSNCTQQVSWPTLEGVLPGRK